MNKKLYQKLNEQINHEFYTANLYLQLSAHFEAKSLNGFAHWMREHFKEEQEHALKIFDFLLQRGEMAELDTVKKPEVKWESPLEAFKAAYEHEKFVTQLITDLMDIAIEVKDYNAVNLLNWYIDEQVEEESTVGYIVDQLTYAKDNDAAIFMLDKELGQIIQ